ncbi:MarR family winged helix-turn-helix transcriptional regulator [Streptomyces sp. B1I3]|uniref:MarR family winged helix-turn-helix transcriptional regulator n=1 Tax=Streptomyces sp. B1I3 TaxID=3042264 RepID=UPI00277F2844|nr:MarR family transcriptional regulator [Streptomyces sp. B1I3]MDQ0794190.1 DNA-binding MarR family transcriptional regulator [Streptomyces sp. B1I3]
MSSDTPGAQERSPADPTAEHVATELAGVVGRLLRRLRSTSAESLLTPSQRSVLARLHDGGPATTAVLARAELVRPQSMRLTLGALESQGLVARAPDPLDGRKSVVSVTDAGRTTLAEVRAAKRGWLAVAIAEELDGEERRTVAEAVALISRLVDT